MIGPALSTTGPLTQAAIILFEAKSLIRLGQGSAAASVLVPLATRIDTPTGTGVTALFGTLCFSEGVTDQVLVHLRRAIDKGVRNWPGRDEAEADFALVLLASGDETAGIENPKEVRSAFERSLQLVQLIRSIGTGATYWRALGNTIAINITSDLSAQWESGTAA